ncbi:hypothetical protein [Limosilactobacillus pontis]|uniref:hypothetical protein n=1 Tax=Limosilactobacillus pontis TaxID=35787 RepID=UPI00241C3D52|nr:hypothetical protein [Limosilactobacillus pontis]
MTMNKKSETEYKNIISEADYDLYNIEGLGQALYDTLQKLLEPIEDKSTVAELSQETVKALVYELVRESKTLMALIDAIYTETQQAREKLQ